MAPRKWDAYSSLQIMSRDSKSMTCVGKIKHYENICRCRWGIKRSRYDEIRALLDEMEGQPPDEAIESLEELAELSLCQEKHQNQVDKVIKQWKASIKHAAKQYEIKQSLREKNKLLEEYLNKEEEKAEQLEDEVEELQARLEKQAKLGELQSEIEILLAEVANEQAKSTSATNRWKKSQLRYENQKNKTDECRRALSQSEQQTTKLKEEKAEISCQLAAVQEALECARGRCEELQKAQTSESTTEERDNLRAEIASLESQLSQLNEQSVQMSQEMERATTQKMALSVQVENLTTELTLESETSRKYQSDLIQTRTKIDTLSEEISDNISSHSLPTRLLSIAALLKRYSPSPHHLLRLLSHVPDLPSSNQL